LGVVQADLVPTLAHADRGCTKGAGLKSSGDLLRTAGRFDKNYGYSSSLERFHCARADSAAQYGLTVPQRFDKSGVTTRFSGAIARSAPVFMTTSVDTGLDESDLPILGFEDEELAAAAKMGGNIDSIVRWYSDLHVRFSLGDTDRSKYPGAGPRTDSEMVDEFTYYLF
jgi:hypothetical protein